MVQERTFFLLYFPFQTKDRTWQASRPMTGGSLSWPSLTLRRLARRSVWCWLSSLLCWSCTVENTLKARSRPARPLSQGCTHCIQDNIGKKS